jgi:hypothetical protein
MPRFDLSKYATVAERLAMFHKDHPDGRIITKMVETFEASDRPRRWVFKASVYLTAGDHAAGIPKATGWASEIDGTGGANDGSAAENTESSAVGRALMLAGYAASKDGKTLASANEMDKMNRIAQHDYLADAEKITTVDDLRKLYTLAMANGAPAEVLGRLKDRATELDTGSENPRAGGSNPRSRTTKAG